MISAFRHFFSELESNVAAPLRIRLFRLMSATTCGCAASDIPLARPGRLGILRDCFTKKKAGQAALFFFAQVE